MMNQSSITPQDFLKEHLAETIELTDNDFNKFFACLTPMSFKKGQTIITEGDTVSCEYFVLEGCLKTFYTNEDEKMFILQFAMPNWWASDYGALYGGTKATVQLDCVTDVEVLRLNSDDRERLCKEIYPLEYFFRWRSNKGYVAQQKRLLSFMNNDAKRRYEELMNMYPQLYNLVPKQLIAAYLGVSRETLSRLY